MPSERLDQALVRAGLAPSRSRAQALIRAGAVTVGGRVVRRPAQPVADLALAVTHDPNPWVSRAALKLLHALDAFGLSPAGVRALDIGASTGGFTEVLLARGAAHVTALAVGRGQLHPRLRADARVRALEGVNARALPSDLGPIAWITADVSFISLTKALPPALTHAAPGAVLVALVKPQFELGPAAVGKGGVVRDDAQRQAAVLAVATFLERAGWVIQGTRDSPIAGSDGNREVLLAALKAPGG